MGPPSSAAEAAPIADRGMAGAPRSAAAFGPILLAFDTATERSSVALRLADGSTHVHEGEGGARASATLLPAIFALLARGGIALGAIDAIAFGRGPGAFTGLRTACSVAQGLALGAAKPVLPIDTLLAVAEDARADDPTAACTWALMDARMDEVYAACYAFGRGVWSVRVAPALVRPEQLAERWRAEPPERVAGNGIGVFGARLACPTARLFPTAWPRAAAMLPLAIADWHAGRGLDAALALPLYLRDKVAQTTAERDAARAAKALAAAGAP